MLAVCSATSRCRWVPEHGVAVTQQGAAVDVVVAVAAALGCQCGACAWQLEVPPDLVMELRSLVRTCKFPSLKFTEHTAACKGKRHALAA